MVVSLGEDVADAAVVVDDDVVVADAGVDVDVGQRDFAVYD